MQGTAFFMFINFNPYLPAKLLITGFSFWSLVFIAFILLSGCNKKKAETEEVSSVAAASFYTVIDGMGNEVKMPKDPKRVLSLSPALTESLFALQADSIVAGVSHVCNYPAERVASKSKITTYPLDFEGIVMLKPDLIFTEEGMTPLQAAGKLEAMGYPVYYFKYRNATDVLNGIDTMGKFLNRSTVAAQVTQPLRKAIDSLKVVYQDMANAPKVLSIISNKPIFVYGSRTFMTEKIRLAGGVNIVSDSFKKEYPELGREYILTKNPEVIFGGTFQELDSSFFSLYPELKSINAYKNKHIYPLNNDLATRPSPRILQSILEMENHLKSVKRHKVK